MHVRLQPYVNLISRGWYKILVVNFDIVVVVKLIQQQSSELIDGGKLLR